MAAATGIASNASRAAFSHARARARALSAPPSTLQAIDQLEARASSSSPEQARGSVEKAWELLRRALPDVRRRWRSVFAPGARVGDDRPPLARSWGWYHSPEDVDRGRREVDAAYQSVQRQAARAVRAGFVPSDGQRAAMTAFDAARATWRSESALLRGSYWRRAWASGANAVEEGAAAYARAQRALVDAGWPLGGSVPGAGLPGQAPSSAARGFGALFSGAGGIAMLAVAAVLVMRGRN